MENNKMFDKANTDDLFVLVENNDFLESERLDVEPYSYWKSVLKEFVKKKSAIFAVVMISVIILMTIFVPIFSTHDVFNLDVENAFVFPNSEFFFGTDRAGRDIFTLIFVGARKSLTIAFIVTLINTTIGVLVGGIWGYFRKLDPLMNEIYNFITNIPSLLIYIMLLYVLGTIGTPPLLNIIIAMTITGWSELARLIRNQIIIFNNREYNIASRTLGSGPRRIIVNNLLPQILSVIITTVSISISQVIALEVTLSYFGLGLPQSDVSLGRILRESYNQWLATPYVLIFPALAVGLITVSFYLIGLSLSDALDPRTHK